MLEEFRLEDEAIAALRRRASSRTFNRPSPLVTPRVLSAAAGHRAADHAAVAAQAAVVAATVGNHALDFERTATV